MHHILHVVFYISSILAFRVLKKISHLFSIDFSLSIFFSILGLQGIQNHMHPGFLIASYSAGLYNSVSRNIHILTIFLSPF